MSQYSDAIRQQRSEMNQHESEANKRMLRAYDDMLKSIDDDLYAITRKIEEARSQGDSVHPDWLRRQDRYTRLMDRLSISKHIFEQTGTTVITDVRGTALERGAVHALERGQLLFEGSDADIFSGRVNLPAAENLLGQTNPGSPLHQVMESHGTNATEIITSGLMTGLSGQGADEILRNISNQLHSPVSSSRLMALVRTEMMNAYRASQHEQYRAFGDEIDGWMWSAHRSPRTCLACLAMDGQTFPMDRPFDQAHVCCRCSASPWPKDIYPSVQAFLKQQGSGEDWVRRQPRATQMKMFPSKDSFEAFERGDLSLMDFVGEVDSPVWGKKIYQLSGRDAMKKRRVKPAKDDKKPIATPMRHLRTNPTEEVATVGQIPSGILEHWPDRSGDDVVLTRNRMEHYLEEHPEMERYEDEIVRTIVDPDVVHAQGISTAVLFRRQDDRHDVVVIVSLSNDGMRSHSIISARIQRSRRKDTARQLKRMIWQRKREME